MAFDTSQTTAERSKNPIATDTALGAVTLNVADLDLLVRYYSEAVGLKALAQAGGRVILGHNGDEVLVLQHTPHLIRASSTAAGLYHTAIVFARQTDLATAVYRVVRMFPHSFTGSADHGFSQAFYFDDPEGNGVELYWDKPLADWGWSVGRGPLPAISDPLDPNRFLNEHLTEQTLDPATAHTRAVGHVHLKVGDTETARSFYSDAIGFDVTLNGFGALFLSAGGYHHHVGSNMWNSAGAAVRTPALGLGQITLLLPDDDELGALRDRLTTQGFSVRDDGQELFIDDPWRNLVRARVNPVASP